ncbi:hypothetical protein HJD18_01950 [Thermoleophilia bacterium SCSIO 60948]|nr:hypothetical protein HJD18_01950 [Thermoleophilia bacterium SCSIO 60948]
MSDSETQQAELGELIELGGSDRAALARLAHEAALATPGVAGASRGPGASYRTQTGGYVLDGVSVIVAADGSYRVGLCLVAAPTPLHDLAIEIRRRIARDVATAGVDAPGAVDIRFDDLATTSERER